MRILTAGESHGEYITAILEGFPQGVEIEESIINQELKRRMSGAGRGKRMEIEEDRVRLVSGLRNKKTLGSPVTMLVKNKDTRIFTQEEDRQPLLTVPRPAHADLAGAFKYQGTDVRNFLERASARETVARVCVGSICKQFLSVFNIKIAGFTLSVGNISSDKKPKDIEQIIRQTRASLLNCIDRDKEKLMIKEIEKAGAEGDSLGGIIEIWIDGACPGLGSFMHFDKRLDAKFAGYLMSIPAVKGVEIGLGFEYAKKRGSLSHDAIYYALDKGFYHRTNNSGGIEAGVTNGEPIILRAAMKPIATLKKPLNSVDLKTHKKKKAIVERCDTCAVSACVVIAEHMSAIALTEAFLDKFGSDSLKEITANYKNYLETIRKF